MMLLKKKIHFVGIGGAGMSSIAEFLLLSGVSVSGSDLKENSAVKRLVNLGAHFFLGHQKSNIGDADMIVFSSAVKSNNVELEEGRKQKKFIMHRSEILGEIMSSYLGVAVCGTHGKSTTAALLTYLLQEMGVRPSSILGGEMLSYSSLAMKGNDQGLLVVEADESDGSFLNLNPSVTLLTNIGVDHLDHFSSHEKIKEIFKQFIQKGKSVIYGFDNEDAREVAESVFLPENRFSFGLDKRADLCATNVRSHEDFKLSFEVQEKKSGSVGTVELSFPGKHNVLNVLAALAFVQLYGLDLKIAIEKCRGFKGVAHRFQVLKRSADITIIDDYAHNPDKIHATLKATREARKSAFLVAVFQPHRYSRLTKQTEEFMNAMSDADLTLVLPVFSAGEAPTGFDSKQFVELLKKNKKPALDVHSLEEVVKIVKSEQQKNIQKHIVLITLGAGDVKDLSAKLPDYFS